MKGMDLFCSSAASAAVISSLNQRFVVSPGSKSYGHDRRKSLPRVPCSSHFPVNPNPYHRKKSTSSADNQNDDVRRTSLHHTHHPCSSRRYLLSDDAPFIDWVSESDQIKNIKNDSPASSKDQVVVLWVSLHCKGCEGKVRKHISKMEGVTSYSTDLETKKVTITGNVTPLGVLASVSKVKKAQLWPSSSISSLSSSSTSTPSSLWST